MKRYIVVLFCCLVTTTAYGNTKTLVSKPLINSDGERLTLISKLSELKGFSLSKEKETTSSPQQAKNVSKNAPAPGFPKKPDGKTKSDGKKSEGELSTASKDSLVISGTSPNGAKIPERAMVVTGEETVEDLLSEIKKAFANEVMATLDNFGRILVFSSTGGSDKLTVSLTSSVDQINFGNLKASGSINFFEQFGGGISKERAYFVNELLVGTWPPGQIQEKKGDNELIKIIKKLKIKLTISQSVVIVPDRSGDSINVVLVGSDGDGSGGDGSGGDGSGGDGSGGDGSGGDGSGGDGSGGDGSGGDGSGGDGSGGDGSGDTAEPADTTLVPEVSPLVEAKNAALTRLVSNGGSLAAKLSIEAAKTGYFGSVRFAPYMQFGALGDIDNLDKQVFTYGAECQIVVPFTGVTGTTEGDFKLLLGGKWTKSRVLVGQGSFFDFKSNKVSFFQVKAGIVQNRRLTYSVVYTNVQGDEFEPFIPKFVFKTSLALGD